MINRWRTGIREKGFNFYTKIDRLLVFPANAHLYEQIDGFKEGQRMKIRKAIIPAAGLGTRFLPATKAQAKEMLPIVDKPTIQYIVEEALASGIEEILTSLEEEKGQSNIILQNRIN